MEFEFDGIAYRLERGRASGVWMLFQDLQGRVSWRFVREFPAAIYDEDIKDRATVFLREGL